MHEMCAALHTIPCTPAETPANDSSRLSQLGNMFVDWNRSETESLHKVAQQQLIRYTCYAFTCVQEARDLVSGSTVVLSVCRLTFRSVQQSAKSLQQRPFARRAGDN